jgi:hypothetical protein
VCTLSEPAAPSSTAQALAMVRAGLGYLSVCAAASLGPAVLYLVQPLISSLLFLVTFCGHAALAWRSFTLSRAAAARVFSLEWRSR